MKEIHTEIQAIQQRLQSIRAKDEAQRSSTTASRMVEMFPSSSATATVSRPGDRTSSPSASTQVLSRDALSAVVESAQQRTSTYLGAGQPTQEQRQSTPEPGQATPSRWSEYRVASRQNPSIASDGFALGISGQLIADAMKRLEAKAEQINQLSANQEAAMLELKAIAERLERDWKAIERQYDPISDAAQEPPALCEYQTTVVPYIERDETGAFVVTSRPLDLFKAEREATQMAQSLRQRTSPSKRRAETHPRSGQVASESLQHLWKTASTLLARLFQARAPRHLPRRTPHRRSQASAISSTAPAMPMTLTSATTWLVGAAVVRIGLDMVLLSFPGLWLPVVGVIIAPTVFAVYRTSVAPQSSLTWVYRLFLIMAGLLIGGRL